MGCVNVLSKVDRTRKRSTEISSLQFEEKTHQEATS